MKSQLSMRHWAFVVIIFPTLLISLLLGGILIYKRHMELENVLIERGLSLAEPLAMLTAKSIQQNDIEFLAESLDLAHRRGSPAVKNITVFSPDHQIFLSTNEHARIQETKLPAGKAIPAVSSVQRFGDIVYIRSPIWGENIKSPNLLVINGDNRALYGYLVVELSRNKVLLQQQSSLLLMVSVLVVALFISFAVAQMFIKKLINPIERINKSIKKIAAGNTKLRITEQYLAELNVLRDGVNTLGKKIHLANEQAEHNISEHTQELHQTVELLEIQNVELSIARKDAQAANDVKSQFLANMSHELRTPLNGVLGFTRQLKKTPLNDNQNDFLETIESSAKNLLRIINDILDFSKLDVGKMELETIPFSLRDTVNEVMTLMAPTIFDRGIDVHLGIDSATPDSLRGDPDRLKQVILNLMGNALKFTHQGFIRLDVQYKGGDEQGHKIKFIVSDTGIGIEKDVIQKLFSAFGQADSSVTRRFGGTGLGLNICKKLIEAMGGKISVKSEKDHGSSFYFDIVVKENSIAVAEPIVTDVLNQKRILIFDNNKQSLNDINNLLTDYTNLKIVTCESQAEFTEKLKQDFDLVLISRNVSPSTIGLLQQLVSEATASCTNTIAMIGSISPNLKEALIGSGAIACISKPINHKKLIEALTSPYQEAEPTEQVKSISFSGLKVLAVDDNKSNLKLLTTLLTEMAVVADTAYDGLEAVNMAKKHSYDLIFMDVQMPIMDGVTACKEIRASSINETTPIISVTAHATSEEQETMSDCGFDDYLAKPIDESVLKQILIEFAGNGYKVTNNQVISKEAVLRGGSAPDFAGYHHIDWPMALQRAAGKRDLAIQMLDLTLKSIPATVESINHGMKEDDVEQVIKAIHKFHGACCYTGIPKIKSLTEQIEINLKALRKIKALEPELFELLDELEQLKEESQSWVLT